MHADALFTLLEMEPAVEQEGARLKALIEARGGGREIDLAGLERSTETLRACSSLARNALRKGTEEKGSAAGAD
jgi:hypothetical protein